MVFHHRDQVRERRRAVPLMLVGLAAAFVSFLHTSSIYFAGMSPGLAPSAISSGPEASLRRMQLSLGQEGGGDFSSEEAFELAAQVIRDDPLNAMAVRFIRPAGFSPNSNGTDDKDLATLRLAERVTRRDRLSQLGLLLAKAERADAEGATVHIDRLFTVNPELIEAVTPELLPLINREEGRRLIAEKSARPWFIPMMRVANRESENPVALADMLLSLENTPPDLERANPGRLAAKLVRSGEFEKALEIASLSGLEREGFDQFEPTDANTDQAFEPLSWRLADNEDGLVAVLGEGRVSFDLSSGRQLSAMERITQLRPGNYNLEIGLGGTRGSELVWEWRAACRSEGGQWRGVWSSDLQAPVEQLTAFPISFPADGTCQFQRWNLFLQSASGQRDASAEMLIRLYRN